MTFPELFDLIRHVWSKPGKFYWQGTNIQLSKFRFFLVVLIIPPEAWAALNRQVESLKEKIRDLENR